MPIGGGAIQVLNDVSTECCDGVLRLFVDGTNVYWNHSGKFFRTPKTGGAATLLGTSPCGLASGTIDSTHLY